MSKVERDGQRDDWGVEAGSFQPSAISSMVGRTASAVRQRNRDPKSEDLGHPAALIIPSLRSVLRGLKHEHS